MQNFSGVLEKKNIWESTVFSLLCRENGGNNEKTISLKQSKYLYKVLLSQYLKLLKYFLDKESMSPLLPFLNTLWLGHKPKASPSQGNSLGWNCNHHPLVWLQRDTSLHISVQKSPLSHCPPQDLAISPQISCSIPAVLVGCRIQEYLQALGTLTLLY